VWWQLTRNGKRRPMDVQGDEATWECHFDTCAGEPVGATGYASAASAWAAADQVAADPGDGRPIGIDLWLGQLGLAWPLGADPIAQVTAAFRKLAMRHHPDMGGDAASFIHFKLAYDRCKELLQEVAA
jgi:hypothetical protein